MRRVLVLAYHFPPVGGAGVQRTVKFVKYLPDLGWNAVVVTGPSGSHGDEGLTDETLEDELPAGLDVRRIAVPEPRAAGRRRGRAERWLRLRSRWTRWWQEEAVRAGEGAEGIDVVLTSMSPFASCAPAAQLADRHGVPWVADLRDPWALDEMVVYPTGLHRRLELAAMRSALSTAAAVVMNTAEAAAALRRAFPAIGADRVHVITNGFDADDFAGPAPARDDAAFRIVHTGDFHTAFGLEHRRRSLARRLVGGSLGEVDVLPRSHVFLLEAVERLRARRPDLRDALEVHFAGSMDAADLAATTSGAVRLHGYLTHAEAVALMRSADLLFLPMHDLPVPSRARIVPGKTYEYLASGRPILAAVPDGDARDLLSRAGSGLLCRPRDVHCLERAIETQADRKLRGEPAPAPDPAVVAALERRRLTERLAGVLEDAARRGAAAAAAASARR